jgi:nucleoside-diphosphate-sugar epimerase
MTPWATRARSHCRAGRTRDRPDRESAGIDYIPYEKAYEPGLEDIGRRTPDISKAVALTGYSPRVDLDEALRKTLTWRAANPDG